MTRDETENDRRFVDARSPKGAIDTIEAKEPAIPENGMISASGVAGFFGSSFVFDRLVQTDEELVSFDELNRIPSGTRRTIQCV